MHVSFRKAKPQLTRANSLTKTKLFASGSGSEENMLIAESAPLTGASAKPHGGTPTLKGKTAGRSPSEHRPMSPIPFFHGRRQVLAVANADQSVAAAGSPAHDRSPIVHSDELKSPTGRMGFIWPFRGSSSNINMGIDGGSRMEAEAAPHSTGGGDGRTATPTRSYGGGSSPARAAGKSTAGAPSPSHRAAPSSAHKSRRTAEAPPQPATSASSAAMAPLPIRTSGVIFRPASPSSVHRSPTPPTPVTPLTPVSGTGAGANPLATPPLRPTVLTGSGAMEELQAGARQTEAVLGILWKWVNLGRGWAARLCILEGVSEGEGGERVGDG